jgi:threonine dehydratase
MPAADAVNHRLSLERIEQAMQVIDPLFLRTPQYRAEALEKILGCRLLVKIETLNPIRSFKGRGASWFLAHVAPGTDLICASAGNFGQAMAYACRSRGVRLIVFASVNANPLKVERMRALGAEVRSHGDDFDAAKVEAKRVAAATGVRMVEDSLEIATGEGAATIGLELIEWKEPLDQIAVALGNGALATGIGRWTKAHSPATRVIAVAAAGAPSMVESWKSGRTIVHDSVETIADGIAVRIPVPEAVADMNGTVDDAILVTDESMLAAMRLLHEHLGLVVEPSGAAGVAAILERPADFRDQLVATVIGGGNVTPQQLTQWFTPQDEGLRGD